MSYIGSKLCSFTGKPIGTITDVLASPADLRPEWIAVKSGLLRRVRLVPASAIVERDGDFVTLVDEDLIKSSPVAYSGVPPTQQESTTLRSHFALTSTRSRGDDPDR